MKGSDPEMRLEQFKLVYDYIKFHIGLYLATPPVFAIVAESFSLKEQQWFRLGLVIMIAIYLVSGVSAGLFMGKYVNKRWGEVLNFDAAYTRNRRFMHHTLYWVGLVVGLLGLIAAYLFPHPTPGH
jgi:MFS family permease